MFSALLLFSISPRTQGQDGPLQNTSPPAAASKVSVEGTPPAARPHAVGTDQGSTEWAQWFHGYDTKGNKSKSGAAGSVRPSSARGRRPSAEDGSLWNGRKSVQARYQRRVISKLPRSSYNPKAKKRIIQLKWAESPTGHVSLEDRQTADRQGHEKVPDVPDHQGNANQNRSGTRPAPVGGCCRRKVERRQVPARTRRKGPRDCWWAEVAQPLWKQRVLES